MKLEVYKKEPTDKTVRLTLRTDKEGAVILYVVNKYGREVYGSNILKINADGTLTRIASIQDKVNFKLNDYSQIKERE